MKNIIISDFDLTLSKNIIIYPYLLLLFYLKCTTFNDKLLKYIKILLLPFVSIIICFIYLLFGDHLSLQFINYFLFYGINKLNMIDTIHKIKYLIIKNLNYKVIDSIDSYKSDSKYIISGNFQDMINIILNKYDFNVYGSIIDINSKTNKYTGLTKFSCLGKNKKIIIDQIIYDQKKLGIKREQINLIAYGDSINDYYIFIAADIRYVIGSNIKLINLLKKENIEFQQII